MGIWGRENADEHVGVGWRWGYRGNRCTCGNCVAGKENRERKRMKKRAKERKSKEDIKKTGFLLEEGRGGGQEKEESGWGWCGGFYVGLRENGKERKERGVLRELGGERWVVVVGVLAMIGHSNDMGVGGVWS